MNSAVWHEEPIGKRHNREAFDCGEPASNEFLQRYARKNHEMGGARTFLAIDDADGKKVLGYYSLSPASVAYARAPELVKRGLARYDVPAFRLARLAVDRKVQGQGLGGQLLLSAGKRCLLASAEVGGVAMLIDAKSARAAAWYASYGALPLLDTPLALLLPLATVAAALKAAGKLGPSECQPQPAGDGARCHVAGASSDLVWRTTERDCATPGFRGSVFVPRLTVCEAHPGEVQSQHRWALWPASPNGSQCIFHIS